MYTHGYPSAAARAALVEHASLIAALEVITPWRAIEQALEEHRALKAATGLPLRLSRLRRHDEEHHHGIKSRHAIEHGFLPGEEAQLHAQLVRPEFREAVDALLFRIARDRSPWSDILHLETAGAALRIACTAYVRLALDNPAQTIEDELADANRVAETVAAARACRHTVAYLDTLNDVDRGYYPRLGLVDRRFNPRLAGKVFQHLQAALEAAGEPFVPGPVSADDDLRAIALVCPRTTWLLLLPARPLTLDRIALPGGAGDQATRLRWIDLAAGVVEPAVACTPSVDGRALPLTVPRTIKAPALICPA